MATLPTVPVAVTAGQPNTPCSDIGQVPEVDQVLQQNRTIEYLTQDTLEIPAFNAGTATADKVIYAHIATVPFSIPVNASGSHARAITLPGAASHSVLLCKGTTSLGAWAFASATSGGGIGVFAASATSCTGVWSFAAGDQLRIVNQATSESTLKDIAFNIKATRL